MNDNGGCDDHCENTNGSFFCACPTFSTGFRPNGMRCIGMYHMSLYVYCNFNVVYIVDICI